MKFKKQIGSYNYPYDEIEIIQFNFDGEGNALVKVDGKLDYIPGKDFDNHKPGMWAVNYRI